jgi:hypothetical protein
MSDDRNKARALALVDEVLNGHDLAALERYTSNPAVIGSATGLVRGFPDLRKWVCGQPFQSGSRIDKPISTGNRRERKQER